MPFDFNAEFQKQNAASSGAGSPSGSFNFKSELDKQNANPTSAAVSQVQKQLNPDPQTAHPLDGYLSRVGSAISSGVSEAGNAIKTSVNANMSGKGEDPLSTGLNVAAPLVKAAASPLMEGIKSLGDRYLKGVEGPLAGPIQKGLDAIGQSQGGQEAKSALAGIVGAWQSFKTAHPTLAGDAKSLFDIATNLPVVAGEADLAKSGASALANGAKDTAENIAGKVSSVKDALAPKTLEKVLATPEADVTKLNPVERKAWFDNQKTLIDTKHEALATQVKQDLQVKSETGIKEAQDLNRELSTTARDKVLDLRPKIIKAMGEQSQTYRSLVDEAMAGKENTPVDKGELKAFVDSRFGEDPGRAAAIKDRLGLTEQVDPLSTGKVSPELRKPATTLGKIYEQAKSLRQTVSKSATKVFSADDKLTDDSISTLLSYMKKSGVDLKEANQFWAEYAPVRNQLVSEAKPFLQADIQTKKFASTLVNVAKGTDVNNENFVSEVENLIGEPMTKEVKDVLSKLDANKKSSIADEIQAKTQQVENEMAKDKALKNLSDKQFEIERQARMRGIIKKIVLAAGGLGVDKVIKKYTGIGL